MSAYFAGTNMYSYVDNPSVKHLLCIPPWTFNSYIHGAFQSWECSKVILSYFAVLFSNNLESLFNQFLCESDKINDNYMERFLEYGL